MHTNVYFFGGIDVHIVKKILLIIWGEFLFLAFTIARNTPPTMMTAAITVTAINDVYLFNNCDI